MKRKGTAVLLSMAVTLSLLAGCSSSTTGNSTATQSSQAAASGSEQAGGSGTPLTSDQHFTMRCSYDVPAGGSMARAIEHFEELVNADPELSQILDVQLFPGAQLYKADETLDATLRGDIELGMFTTWYADSVLPYSSTFDLPLLFDNVEEMIKFVNESELAAEVWAPFEEIGGHCFGGTVTGEYGLLTSGAVVEKPEDCAGLLIRSTGDGSLTWSTLGASPVNLSAGDIFTGLQRKTIHAADIGPISVKDRNLYEVSDFYLHTFFHSTLSIYVVNKAWWDQLPDDVAARIEQYMVESIKYCNDFVSGDMETALQLMEENGITIFTPTPEERQVWRDALEPVYQQIGYDKMGKEYMDKLLEWCEAN
ncbi:MAG: TRAP transporter substrate-binding protein DctP [Lachnospiraceae bacterium]|nr:TRAP transporter substrate-binding protein DctP [Lachnospiraceae bacterium]